jgi:hypothetical protein
MPAAPEGTSVTFADPTFSPERLAEIRDGS